MKRFLTLLFVACIYLVPALAEGPTELEALQKVIDKHHATYIKLLKDENAEGFRELFHQDSFVLNPGAPLLQGLDRIVSDRASVFLRADITEGVIRTLHLEMSGDLAYEIGQFSYTVKVADQPARIVGGKYLTVWKRGADGVWRYQVDAGLPD